MRENKNERDFIVFRGDENGYQLWLQENPHGFVLNTNDYSDDKLHTAECRWIKEYTKKCQSFTENRQFKVCSLSIKGLEKYRKNKRFKLEEICKICKP